MCFYVFPIFSSLRLMDISSDSKHFDDLQLERTKALALAAAQAQEALKLTNSKQFDELENKKLTKSDGKCVILI